MQWLIDRLNMIVARLGNLELIGERNDREIKGIKDQVTRLRKVTDYQGSLLVDHERKIGELEEQLERAESRYRGKAISAGRQRAARLRAEDKLKNSN